MCKIVLTGFLFFAFVYSYAQEPTVISSRGEFPKSQKMIEMESKFFCCPFSGCTFASMESEKCSIHDVPTVKVGNYYCPECGRNSAEKKFTCPVHRNIPAQQMQMKYMFPAESLPKNYTR